MILVCRLMRGIDRPLNHNQHILSPPRLRLTSINSSQDKKNEGQEEIKITPLLDERKEVSSIVRNSKAFEPSLAIMDIPD